jgi:hypothetical protein
MKGTENMAARDLNKFKDNFNSIFFNNNTYQAALVASGCVLEVGILNSEKKSFFASERYKNDTNLF